MVSFKFKFWFFILMLLFYATSNCSNTSREDKESVVHKKDINQVLNTHAKDLMEIEGVTGLFVGQTDKGEPCIKIMVIEKNENLEKIIPRFLEGYPVVIHESGVIRPMEKK